MSEFDWEKFFTHSPKIDFWVIREVIKNPELNDTFFSKLDAIKAPKFYYFFERDGRAQQRRPKNDEVAQSVVKESILWGNIDFLRKFSDRFPFKKIIWIKSYINSIPHNESSEEDPCPELPPNRLKEIREVPAFSGINKVFQDLSKGDRLNKSKELFDIYLHIQMIPNNILREYSFRDLATFHSMIKKVQKSQYRGTHFYLDFMARQTGILCEGMTILGKDCSKFDDATFDSPKLIDDFEKLLSRSDDLRKQSNAMFAPSCDDPRIVEVFDKVAKEEEMAHQYLIDSLRSEMHAREAAYILKAAEGVNPEAKRRDINKI